MPRQNIIGQKLRSLRESRSLTQEQLVGACQRLGWDISRVTLAKIETSVRAVNDAEVVVLAASLNCLPGALLNHVPLSDAIGIVRQGKSGR